MAGVHRNQAGGRRNKISVGKAPEGDVVEWTGDALVPAGSGKVATDVLREGARGRKGKAVLAAAARELRAEPVPTRKTSLRGVMPERPVGRVMTNAITGAFTSRAFASLIDRDPAVARAVSFLVHRGVLTGLRSKKVSTRVDPGVMDAAKKRFGLSNESDVINASLAMAAAPDRFKAWLQDSQDTVTNDFELAV